MNSEKYINYILCDFKMQCECVAFPCKEYIFMKDKAHDVGQSTLRYITEGDQVTQQI